MLCLIEVNKHIQKGRGQMAYRECRRKEPARVHLLQGQIHLFLSMHKRQSQQCEEHLFSLLVYNILLCQLK